MDCNSIEIRNSRLENRENEDQAGQEERSGRLDHRESSWMTWLPRVALLVCILTLVAIAIVHHRQLSLKVEAILTWVKDNKEAGPPLIALTYLLWTMLMLPGFLVGIGAGWTFQQAYGDTV